jgi:MFS family permease
VVSLFNDFASEMVYPLLPALVTRTLGGGAVALSLIDGASELTSAVVKWLSGGLADRPGWRRPLILGGYLTAVLVRPLISVASAAWQVVGFRVIDRLGKGIRTPPRDALIAEVTPARLRGRAFGFHRGADHLGAVLGSLAAWWLVAVSANVREVIGWSIAPGLLAFAILAVTLRGVPDGGAGAGGGPQSERGRRASADAAGQRFWAPVLALAALTFCRIPELLLLLRLQQVGVAVAAVPLVWAALHVVRSAASYPGGWLTDRVGSRAAVAGGGLVFAAVAIVMGLPLGAGGMAAVFLAFGLVAGLTESAERSLVARLAPVRTGRGFGAYHALTGLAALPASFVFGEIYQRVSPRAALWTSAAAVAAAVVGWLAASPRERVGGVIG